MSATQTEKLEKMPSPIDFPKHNQTFTKKETIIKEGQE